MSRLHKESKVSLSQKYFLLFFLLIAFGIYKNGLLPLVLGYQTLWQTIMVFLFPIISYGIGAFFDFYFKSNDAFSYRLISLGFCLMIPFQVNILVYTIILTLSLFLYRLLRIKKPFGSFNTLALGRIFLVLACFMFGYGYENGLEQSGLYHYSFWDTLIGHQVGGLYCSSPLLLFISYLVLASDYYYKKDIPIYGYATYLLTLFIYSLTQGNMSFLLTNMFSSPVLFGLIFLSSFSLTSPYLPKERVIYGLLLGVSILPFSLVISQYDGIYFAIVLASIIVSLIHYLHEKKSSTFSQI